MIIWDTDVPGSSADGPEVGMDLIYFRSIKKTNVGMGGQGELLEGRQGLIVLALQIMVNSLAFILFAIESLWRVLDRGVNHFTLSSEQISTNDNVIFGRYTNMLQLND